MSLDVYLSQPGTNARKPAAIYVRENGATVPISRAEWDRRYPGREPVVFAESGPTDEVFHRNITHNLGAMARAAGICDCLWRPNETGITKARQLVGPLVAGLAWLTNNPAEAKKHNPPNGWGNYEGLVAFVEAYAAACAAYPDADVRVSG